MIVALLGGPALAGVVALLLRSDRVRRGWLLVVAAAHLGLTLAAAGGGVPAAPIGGWLALDGVGALVLSVTSLLFAVVAVYAVGYLARESESPPEAASHATDSLARRLRQDFDEGVLFSDAPEAMFTACLLFFLATMTLVAVSHHLGLLWVGIEATTLASAPLIYFHRHHRSLEATWKYLLICSVGIAVALLGTFFLAAATAQADGSHVPLRLAPLLDHAASLHPVWLKGAFICLLVGYGTKMGLAPLHTWLPDAHSEAPSAVSALLSGALLNCAFVGILRAYQIMAAAGEAAFARELLIALGLLSLGFAVVFILAQRDFKRLLAYSSVEHMGLLALSLGLGGAAMFGGCLHLINHAFAKGLLFLTAGNIMAAYHSKHAADVQGVLRARPWSGLLWMGGFLAITGSPPFGTFFSELIIVKAAFDQGATGVAIAILAALALIFLGMGSVFLGMAQGRPPDSLDAAPESVWAVAPPFVLALLVLAFGLSLPPLVTHLVEGAVRTLGNFP